MYKMREKKSMPDMYGLIFLVYNYKNFYTTEWSFSSLKRKACLLFIT